MVSETNFHFVLKIIVQKQKFNFNIKKISPFLLIKYFQFCFNSTAGKNDYVVHKIDYN